MAKYSFISDIKTTQGIVSDNRTTLGNAGVGRPRNLKIDLESISSEEQFGQIALYVELDQTIGLESIDTIEAFGTFWYYKFDTSWESKNDGGGIVPSKSDYDTARKSFKKETRKTKQTINFDSINSKESFGDIEIDQFINFSPFIFRSSVVRNIKIRKFIVEEDEALIFSLLLAA